MTISTRSILRTATLTAGLCSVAACSRGNADRTSYTPDQALDSSQNAPAAPADDAARVYIDAKILAACGLTLPQAYFSFDSAKLGTDDEQELQAVADCLVSGKLAEASVTLVGHSDPQGSSAYNEDLSEDRAQSVMQFLERAGVGVERMEVMPMGEEVASEDPSEWPADRRVDIRLVGEG